MSTVAASSLGTRLRAERECRGLTLEQVSASTKIPVALLDALERDDLSRWPKGFYRRALFRAYVTALGLQPEPLAGEFARLFPDERSSERPRTPVATAGPLALVLSPDEPPAPMPAEPAGRGVLRSLAVALVEAAVVLTAGGLLGLATGMSLLTASGAVALVYYPFIRAGAWRTRQSLKATLRTGKPRVEDGARPTPTPAQPAAVTVARLSATQRLRSGLAVVRTRLGHLHSHVARTWLPLAKRMIVTAYQGSRRVGTRAWHATRRAAVATYRMSSQVGAWATVVLRRAGTAANHAVRKWPRLVARMIVTAYQGSRRAGTRAWHATRPTAVATYRMSSRVGAWAIGVLWRAGTVAARVVREWLVLAARMIVTAYHGSRRAGTRAWHVTRHAAVATYRVLSRVVTRASVVLWHAATVTGRVSGRAARQMGRVCMRGALWANQAFWRAVLIAAGHAEQLAARQLNQKSE